MSSSFATARSSVLITLGAASVSSASHVGPRPQRLLAHLDLRLAADRFGAALRLVQASRDLRLGGGARLRPIANRDADHRTDDEAGRHGRSDCR